MVEVIIIRLIHSSPNSSSAIEIILWNWNQPKVLIETQERHPKSLEDNQTDYKV